MALEQVQSVSDCPPCPYHQNIQGQPTQGLGALPFPNKSLFFFFYPLFVLTFWCKKKTRTFRPSNMPFLFCTLFNGSSQCVLLILKLCPDTWGNLATGYSFFCPWVLNSWILRTWEQHINKRIDELSCGSIKGKEAQQEVLPGYRTGKWAFSYSRAFLYSGVHSEISFLMRCLLSTVWQHVWKYQYYNSKNYANCLSLCM